MEKESSSLEEKVEDITVDGRSGLTYETDNKGKCEA